MSLAETGFKTADMSDEQKKANLKTGMILASVALVFLLGFVVKMVLLGR